MAVEILMPELGESVHEGTISRWLKKEGEYVKEDEPVVEIMTDKVNTELGAPASGVLVQILIPEGSPVEVFKVMGLIDETAKAGTITAPPAPAPEAHAQPTSEPATAPVEATSAPAAAPKPAGDRKRWYTPVVRSVAEQHGLTDTDLESIEGTGDGGRVTKRDVEKFLAQRQAPAVPSQAVPAAKPTPTAAAPAGGQVVALTGMRKMIADAMVRSAAVPVVTTLTDVDVTGMVKFRESNKESFLAQHGVKLTYTPFFIKAIVESLGAFPMLNASLQGDQLHTYSGVHLGVAVSLGPKGDQGLIVPVIRDAQDKSLIELAKELEEIALKARNNQLTVADVQGGTFTLTNPGSYGAVLGTPMINAPQSGILGTYAIKKMPVIVDDMIAVRSIMNLVLTYDHRIVDGMVAGKFLQAVKATMEKFDFFK